MGRAVQTKRKRHGTQHSSTAGKAKLVRASASQAARSRQGYARANTVSAGFLGIEKKFYDTFLAATALSGGTTMANGEKDPSATSMISTPAQGDTASNREGKRIVIKSVQLKGRVILPEQFNETAPDAPMTIMVALVQDSQTNAAQLNSEDVYSNPSAQTILTTSPLRNLYHGSRFRVLKSQEFVMDSQQMVWDGTNIEQGGLARPFDWYIPLGDGIPVNFNSGTTSSVANVVDNSLHVIAYCSKDATCQIAYNARIRFVG